jgi:hypothetical protein
VLIPPLDRIFSLAGCDVRKWYLDMPKAKSLDIDVVSPSKFKHEQEGNIYIDGHFSNSQCFSCGTPSEEGKWNEVEWERVLNNHRHLRQLLFESGIGHVRAPFEDPKGRETTPRCPPDMRVMHTNCAN